MACGRCRSARAGAKTSGGLTIVGYKLTYPPALDRAAETFLTKIEAERARREAGGGNVEQLTS